MSAPFVDHLQLLPMPHKDGRRQPDGAHRPGGLGLRTIADRLEERGWVARIEDIGYDKPLTERRLAEAYARGLADAVSSARDRNRFPLLLVRSSYGAIGAIDALGERTGVVWVDARGAYGRPSRWSRPPLDRCALSLVTGRVERDRFAVQPVRLAGERIVLVGGDRAGEREREALLSDGIRVLGADELTAEALDRVAASAWYLHVELGALDPAAAPAADDPAPGGIDPATLGRSIAEAFAGRPLHAATFARYDLNRDVDGRTLATLVDLMEAAVVAAGGVPSPERDRTAA